VVVGVADQDVEDHPAASARDAAASREGSRTGHPRVIDKYIKYMV